MWWDDESDLPIPSIPSGSISTVNMTDEEKEEAAQKEKNPIGFVVTND